MIKNYLKTALRNMIRHKGFSFINIIGLAIGISICFLIALFIFHEISYDKFHDGSDRIYRLTTSGELNGQSLDYAVSMAPLAIALNTDLPEMGTAVRLTGEISNVLFKYEDKQFFEDNIQYSSPEFFKVFSINLINGNKEDVLAVPGNIAISKSMADRFFGDDDPLGKTLRMSNSEDFTVTGVFEDIPTNSHLSMNAIIAFTEVIPDEPIYWGRFDSYTYFKLNENVDPEEFKEKIKLMPMDKMGITLEETGMEFRLELEKMTDIHLYSEKQYNQGNEGSATYVYVFSAIALFILFIAYINFINLTTAHYTVRAKEIGVRKINGAERSRIMAQFLVESVLITLIAAVFAYGLVEILLPVFNNIIGKQLDLSFLPQGTLIIFSLISIIVLGLIAGLYPAVYLSGLNPISIIRGELIKNGKKSYFRNILVVFQFIISITLICSTGIIYKQLKYYESKELGFDKDHVLLLNLKGRYAQEKAELLKDSFAEISGVNSVSLSNNYPSSGASGGHGFYPEGMSEEKPILLKEMSIDHDFIETFGIELSDGRNFSEEFSTDSEAILVNETLLTELGWEEAVGRHIGDPNFSQTEGVLNLNIIGVLKDFHVNPLSESIEPMIFYLNHRENNIVAVKIDPANMLGTISDIEKKWKELIPDIPFESHLLDEQFNQIHLTEHRLGKLFIYFSILAVLIACLGLFGLSSFVIQRRIKEIGIRKVLGSSILEILILLTTDFTKWILLANLIAWPVAYFAMEKWLENFVYRTSIDIFTFIASGLIALLIAIFTISFKTFKAANSNPVNALKYE